MSIPEVRRIERPAKASVVHDTAEAPPAAAPAVGWQKHIVFGGQTAGGVNIPGGLRMPVRSDRTVRTNTANGRGPAHPAVRPAPEPVGWDRNISFGGSTAGGVNIPGGLRAPAPKTEGQQHRAS